MEVISIGRDSSNRIVIPDNSSKISRNHGTLRILDNGSMQYSDHSTNGTWVNGNLVRNSEVSIQRGANIMFPNRLELDWSLIPMSSKEKSFLVQGDRSSNIFYYGKSNQESGFNTTKIFSNAGATLALIFILFAPVVGCGSQNMNGIDLLSNNGIDAQIKIFILLALVFAGVIFFLKAHLHSVFCAILGALSLFIAYLIAHSKNEAIELKIGAFVAFIGYAIIIVVNFLSMADKNKGTLK